MKKKVLALVIIAMTALTVMLSGCVVTDKEYFAQVSAYTFWDNEGKQSIAQYKIYEMMDSFLADGEIVDGNVVGADGKFKKVMFLGWDGVRADAISNIFHDESNFATNGYNYAPDDFSGLQQLKREGGLYMAYAGGEKGKDSQQSSSTCAGWTSILTGGWNGLHGVKENSDIKSSSADTIMLKYAKLGVKTGLAFDWGQLFDLTFQKEVDVMLQQTLPIKYCDFDRPVAKNNADIMANEGLTKESQILAQSLEHYNAVANTGTISDKSQYDIAARDYLMERINAGDVFSGAIFHRPDTNGHTTGFGNQNPNYVNSVRNADGYLYQLLQVVKQREATQNEDWLVIVTADHGGSGTGHGEQVFEHRTTFLATNKQIDSKYYGKGYDGYIEN